MPDQGADLNSINAVHYKPQVSGEVQNESARNICTMDKARMEENWRDNILIAEEFQQWKQPMLDMLE